MSYKQTRRIKRMDAIRENRWRKLQYRYCQRALLFLRPAPQSETETRMVDQESEKQPVQVASGFNDGLSGTGRTERRTDD